MWDLASGTNNPEYAAAPIIFPNPFQSSFTIQFAKKTAVYALAIMNLQGQKLFIRQGVKNGDVITPDNHLPSGIYLLQITSETGQKEIVKLQICRP